VNILYPENIKPFSHQKVILEYLSKNNICANLSECGTGKTFVGVAWLMSLLENKLINKALVFCPKSIAGVWKNEIQKMYDYSKIKILHGPKRIAEYSNLSNGIAITNYEQIINKDFSNAIRSDMPQAIILDESHKIKNPKAKSAKIILGLGENVEYKMIQTATPKTSSYLEFFNQFKFLDSNIFSINNYYSFRMKYFKQINDFLWVPRRNTKIEIQRLTKPYSFHYDLDSVADAPEIIQSKIEPILDSRVMKKYNKAIKKLTPEDALSPDAPGLIKLRQIASGFIYDEEKVATHIHNCKLDSMVDIVDSIGPDKKIIIWAHFIEDYSRIEKELLFKLKWIKEKNILNLYGFNDKHSKIEEFKSGKYDVMIANPKSAGYGHTINCKYVIWYGIGISSSDYYQARMRVRRIGVTTSRIMEYVIVSKGTIEKLDYDKVLNKYADTKKYLDAVCEHLNK